jgi:hypothetical protein
LLPKKRNEILKNATIGFIISSPCVPGGARLEYFDNSYYNDSTMYKNIYKKDSELKSGMLLLLEADSKRD